MKLSLAVIVTLALLTGCNGDVTNSNNADKKPTKQTDQKADPFRHLDRSRLVK